MAHSVDEPSTPHQQDLEAQVYALAAAIPAGQVMSYGELGARCAPPISGYICGRMMSHCPPGIPWWRVVARNGTLPVDKRNSQLADFQRRQLTAEGHHFDEAGRLIRFVVGA